MRSTVILRPRPGVTLDEFFPLMEAEEKTLWSYITAGSVRAIHYATDAPGTIVLDFETDDGAAAGTLAEGFPMVKAGLFDVEVLALAPYQGLAALFDAEHEIAPELPAPWRAAAQAH